MKWRRQHPKSVNWAPLARGFEARTVAKMRDDHAKSTQLPAFPKKTHMSQLHLPLPPASVENASQLPPVLHINLGCGSKLDKMNQALARRINSSNNARGLECMPGDGEEVKYKCQLTGHWITSEPRMKAIAVHIRLARCASGLSVEDKAKLLELQSEQAEWNATVLTATEGLASLSGVADAAERADL